MQTCGVCRRALRADENLRLVQTDAESAEPAVSAFMVSCWGDIPGGTITAMACPRCRATFDGADPPEPKTYPRGRPVPCKPGSDGDIDICGVCRRAMFLDDRSRGMRLQPEDVADCLELDPGLYPACRECIARFRPRICERLKATGVVGPYTEPETLGGDMLM